MAETTGPTIALLGATGATGAHVLECAKKRKVTVRAIVRDRARLEAPSDEDLEVVEAPLSDLEQLTEAFRGVDAVVSTLGVSPRTPNRAPSEDLPTVLQAMEAAGVKRYIGISGAGLTLPGERKPLIGRLIAKLVAWSAPQVFADKVREHEVLAGSDIEWTLARAPRLVDGAPTGTYEVHPSQPPGFKLTRGDMASFMLDQIGATDWIGKAPVLGQVR